jgi:long-chain acyl-CoA synthetase
MRGYWKRPDDTRAAIVDDGWLRSGDQAAIEDGRVRIIGRIKEIIVTSTGEKIAPVDLEDAITADPLFEQAWVIGDDRPFIAAFVVLGEGRWRELAASLGLDPSRANLDARPVREAVLHRIEFATRRFPRYAVPRQVRISPDQWTVQNGLITPTLKLKRHNLQAHFAAQIEDLYGPRKR